MTLQVVSVSDVETRSPELSIVATAPAHIRELRDNIRDEDRDEIESYGFSCAKALWRSYKGSLFNKTLLIDKKVAACWGCGGAHLGEVGGPWLITSKEVEKLSPLRFARMYIKEVAEMMEKFPRLEGYVADSYEKSIRLLGIVGFTMGEPEVLGNGIFRKFSLGIGV